MTESNGSVVRGQQVAEPRLHWRLDGRAGPDAPLVLALHGWGMDEDFFALLLQKLFDRPVHFLLPRAPLSADPSHAEPEATEAAAATVDAAAAPRAGTDQGAPAASGTRARRGGSWYPYDGNQTRFHGELLRVEQELTGLVREVEAARGLVPRRRYLVGFSQGGYCGAWTALRNPDLFSGMAIVGARVKTELLDAELRAAAAAGFRALLLHGDRDRSVRPDAAARSLAALEAAGIDVELKTFDAGHSLGRAQVAAVGEWLDARAADRD